MNEKHWMGEPPAICQMCCGPMGDAFVDGAVRGSSWAYMCWAYMCERCHRELGVGLGEGKGQKYVKQKDGSFLKVAG